MKNGVCTQGERCLGHGASHGAQDATDYRLSSPTGQKLPHQEDCIVKLGEWLDQWSLSGLKINAGFLSADFQPNDVDADAAWELYVELLTRVTTQALSDRAGTEDAALASVHSLFKTTRDILKTPGRRHASSFAKLAIVVLNQKVRPFTAKWHLRSVAGAFKPESADYAKERAEFRDELRALQQVLTHYGAALANVAGVEDLTHLEDA
jgi:hypothetical protein